MFNLVKDDKKFWHLDSYNNYLGPWLGGYQRSGSSEPNGGWTWIIGEKWT